MIKISENLSVLLVLLVLSAFSACPAVCGVSAQTPLELEYPEIMGEELASGASLPEYIRYIFSLSIVITVLIAFASLIYGGFRYITSASSPSITADAKDQMGAGILGLGILLCSYLILATINPQLLTLTLPGLKIPKFEYTPPPEPEKETLFAEEIPLGALINSSSTIHFYSDFQGILHPKRISRIKLVSEKANKAVIALIPLMANLEKESKTLKDYAEKLKIDAETLKDYVNKCKCPNNCSKCCNDTGCGSCACNCKCSGDPCPERRDINTLRNIIIPRDIINIQNQKPITAKSATTVDVFTNAFEAFVKKNNKVEDFVRENQDDINNFLSIGLQKLIFEMQNLENTTTSQTYILSDGSSFTTPDYSALRYEPEKQENDIENNKIYLRKAVDELIKAENKTKQCSNRQNLISYNNFYQYKEYKEKLEIIKEIEVIHWPGTTQEPEDIILPGSDPSTFYCSKYGPAVILTEEGTYCTIEIPIGEAIDMTEDLGEKIYQEIEKIYDNGWSAANNGFNAASKAKNQIDIGNLEIEQAQKPGADNDLIDLTSAGSDRTKDCVNSCPNVPCASACVPQDTGNCCREKCKTTCSGEGEDETCNTTCWCVANSWKCICQTCKGEHPCPISQINSSFSKLNRFYNTINNDYNQIKIAYEYVRDTSKPNIKNSSERINSEKDINEDENYTISEKTPEIAAKLIKSRKQLDKCFTSNTEWADYYAKRILMKILVECETAKSEYLKKESLVNNCYGFDIDHPLRADNFLCCESE